MKYSIGTLVTNWDEYNLMKESFLKKGFTETDCEFLTVDNTDKNTMDAFSGNNWLLSQSKGEYVILCHQDVRIKYDSRKFLEIRLDKLNQIDPNWGLVGNAGGIEQGRCAIRISDPYGTNQHLNGPFPVKVMSLDGNFILVKKSANLGFSRDLTGFHFYDADICLHATMMGWSIYVIDFHLEHLGKGTLDSVFMKNKETFRNKWIENLKGRIMQLTTTVFTIPNV